MKTSPELVVFAKVMLGIFGALGIFAIGMTVRLFMRPPEPSTVKLAATKRTLMLSSWLVIPIVGNAVKALTTREYWLLLVSALLFSYVLPVLVQFLRIRTALKSTPPTA
ncbi:MAG TPA: hypothetical protein VMP68_22725 [Candidatus Eisenbacteria bacterium]|nr:hypothetical protein [Candidatus Eisenbacteria bacterium]